jgi:hypothetical protein
VSNDLIPPSPPWSSEGMPSLLVNGGCLQLATQHILLHNYESPQHTLSPAFAEFATETTMLREVRTLLVHAPVFVHPTSNISELLTSLSYHARNVWDAIYTGLHITTLVI